MTTVFLSGDVWPQITKAIRGSRQPCAVAVAYFGAGASRLLPLPYGSRLVVDASERAVTSGQTCPADLLNLVKRGVSVYSVPNLHAKVFVVDRAAYIGSTNVSSRSANHLVEAVICTTEPGALGAARKFVYQHCLHELTPELLKRLGKLYRPPRIPGGKRSEKSKKDSSRQPTLPRLLLAQLEVGEWSERDQNLHDAGLTVARKRRLHPRSFEMDSFRWAGKCPYKRGDVVIQVTREGANRSLVAPPGNVLHVRTRRDATGQVSFIYVELPSRRRRQIASLSRAIGYPQKKLYRGGLIREYSFVQALLKAWAMTS